jgi:hypothetical protein
MSEQEYRMQVNDGYEFERVNRYVQASEAGLNGLKDMNPFLRLRQAIDSKPDIERACVAVLAACDSPKTLDELEDALNEIGIKTRYADGSIDVYPSHILDVLDRAGVVVWDSGWVITDEGRETLRLFS